MIITGLETSYVINGVCVCVCMCVGDITKSQGEWRSVQSVLLLQRDGGHQRSDAWSISFPRNQGKPWSVASHLPTVWPKGAFLSFGKILNLAVRPQLCHKAPDDQFCLVLMLLSEAVW